eukprot:365554-Chlamydomonas_euryale.AAC.10
MEKGTPWGSKCGMPAVHSLCQAFWHKSVCARGRPTAVGGEGGGCRKSAAKQAADAPDAATLCKPALCGSLGRPPPSASLPSVGRWGAPLPPQACPLWVAGASPALHKPALCGSLGRPPPSASLPSVGRWGAPLPPQVCPLWVAGAPPSLCKPALCGSLGRPSPSAKLRSACLAQHAKAQMRMPAALLQLLWRSTAQPHCHLPTALCHLCTAYCHLPTAKCQS